MFALHTARAGSPAELYAELLEQARALLHGERDATANAANLASLVFHTLPELNWAGFYWLRGGAILGVLDLDSPRPGRFTDPDARGMEAVVRAFVEATEPG